VVAEKEMAKLLVEVGVLESQATRERHRHEAVDRLDVNTRTTPGPPRLLDAR
jgi:hypothetical protein